MKNISPPFRVIWNLLIWGIDKVSLDQVHLSPGLPIHRNQGESPLENVSVHLLFDVEGGSIGVRYTHLIGKLMCNKIKNYSHFFNIALAKKCRMCHLFNPFSAGTIFIRQDLTSVDARLCRIKMVPALKELKYL